jgi:hypothetical protein
MRTRSAIVALVTAVALLTTVIAGPRKVLVLPLDGNAPATQKGQLNDSVAKLAKTNITGDVTIGDTTFAETAAAVGCDPANPACAETVRATLSVDELVYGSAKTENGSTTVSVSRVSKGASPTSQVTEITESDSGDKAEAGLAPVFTGTGAVGSDVVGSGSEVGSGSAVRPRAGHNFFDTRERKLGVGLAAGGVISLVIGLSFWAGKSDLQDQIDAHDKETLADFTELHDLEDRAASKALWGNILVGLGLGLAGVGAYYLYKDKKNRSATLTPAPVEAGSGMTLVLRGRW